jgi:hypothetical protein
MYIECKAASLNGPARIGRVTFSKTGKGIYYRAQFFHSLKGQGLKANYRNEQTGEQHWISGPHRDGQDRLYVSKHSSGDRRRREGRVLDPDS